MVGPITEASLAALRFDTVVLTCCGISATAGITAHDLQDAAVKRAAVKSSRRTVVVAEGAKFTRTALASVCPVEAIDVLITDETAPSAALDQFRAADIDVRVAVDTNESP
jgi:DeoR/GlpR family transcriptional regulator of sugar metabolism